MYRPAVYVRFMSALVRMTPCGQKRTTALGRDADCQAVVD